MATAKKAPAKKATNRRNSAAAKAAQAVPAKKRVVRRKPKQPEAVFASPIPSEAMTDNSPVAAPQQDVPERSALLSADVVVMKGLDIKGRFLLAMTLEQLGFVCSGCTQREFTESLHSYIGQNIEALRLQQRNKLVTPISMSDVRPEELLTRITDTSISVDIGFSDPEVDTPKELFFGGSIYQKASS